MAEQNNIARRSFFAGLGLAAAAGVIAKISPQVVTSTNTSPETDPGGDGYRLTEHIKKYYRTTTI